MIVLVLLCVALGIALPGVFSALNACTVGLFAFMTFASSLGSGFRELWAVLAHPLPVVAAMLLLHVALPVLALGLGNLLFPAAPLFTTGLVLGYAVPTGVASLMWVGIARGNAPLCLSLVLLDTLCSPVVIPLTMKLLAGSAVKMDTLGMMGNLMVMAAIPAVAAMVLYQGTRGRAAVTLQPRLAPFSKLALLTIILANATSCAPFLRNITPTLVLVMLATFALCLLGFFLGYWAGRLFKLDFPTVQTLTLNVGMRNISAGAVLAEQYFPPDVMFPVAFSPIFLQLTTAVIVQVLARIGRKNQKSALDPQKFPIDRYKRRIPMVYALTSLLAVSLLALDQWVKHWITVNIPLGQAREFLPGFLELRTVHNYGAAWSSFSGMRWLLVAVTSAIVLAVLFLLVKKFVRHPLGVTACALIVSGGLGNIIDRARLGYVVDMFNFQFIRYPVFNVADICVVCGAILGMIYYLWLYEKHDGKGKLHGEADAPDNA